MRDLYPLGAVVGIIPGVMLCAAIGYHYVEWFFYSAAAVISISHIGGVEGKRAAGSPGAIQMLVKSGLCDTPGIH